MHRPLSGGIQNKGRHIGAKRRISQNIVASQRLPPGQSLCLGLLLVQLEGGAAADERAKIPADFKSVVLADEVNRSTLLVYHRNVICVGTSSLDKLLASLAFFRPILKRCRNTPENLAAERELIRYIGFHLQTPHLKPRVRNGTLDPKIAQKALNYAITFSPNGDIENVKRIDDDQGAAKARAIAATARKRKRVVHVDADGTNPGSAPKRRRLVTRR